MAKKPNQTQMNTQSPLEASYINEEPSKTVSAAELPFQELENIHEKSNKMLSNFNELLDSLSSTEDKLKSLWRQIYENSVTDRMNAYVAWADLYRIVQGNASEHAIHGQNLSRYMERMSKANDQLIKLADLVGAAKKKDSTEFTEDSLYQEMEST
jgi:hypothetical protein